MQTLTLTDFGLHVGKHSERLIVKKGKETLSKHPRSRRRGKVTVPSLIYRRLKKIVNREVSSVPQITVRVPESLMEDNKRKAVEKFVSRLKERAEDRIYAIYLFGSMAKGRSRPDSDIDVLVVFSGSGGEKVWDDVLDLSFEISCELGEVIQAVLMSEEEYRASVGRSPFLWEVVEHGEALFQREAATQWELDFQEYIELDREYLGYASDAAAEGKVRLAIDTAYNAAELLVKALIISKKASLASSHGGVVGQFGQLFVVPGEVSAEVGRNLHRALNLRAQARYRPKAHLTEEDAQAVLSLAQTLLKFAEEYFKTR